MKENTQSDFDRDFLMHFEKKRLVTFKDWPFEENCECTPDKMAGAGFYHCPTAQEPDLAKCYICLKELDGWEPTDDPWKEHKSHSGHCDFLKWKKNKKAPKLTVRELIQLEGKRQYNILKKAQDKKIAEFRVHAGEGRSELEVLAN